MTASIEPHGGKLVSRILEGKDREEAEKRAEGLKKLPLNDREISDLEMIAIGALSPLEGFMKKDDYHSVMDTMTLKNGLPWTIPITLSTTKDEAKGLKQGGEVSLTDASGNVLALLKVEEIFPHDKEKEAKQVYEMGEMLIGGTVSILKRPEHADFTQYRLDPKETRALFKEKGWKRVVGFQTRNPIHRAHEYLQKCALEGV